MAIVEKYTFLDGEISKIDGGYLLSFSAEKCSRRRSYQDHSAHAWPMTWECSCSTWSEVCERLKEFLDHKESDFYGGQE